MTTTDTSAAKYLIANHGHTWHLAARREIRGAVTGKLMHVYHVPACNGRSIGGSSGVTVVDTIPSMDGNNLCAQCAKRFGIVRA